MKIYQTPHAPKAIWPYSQAISAGGFLFLSGQIGLNPETMTLTNTSLEDETIQIISNITAILENAWLHRENVLKTTIFLTDMSDFAKVNEVYEKYFSHKPARSTVAVKELPKWARLEIECIAAIGG